MSPYLQFRWRLIRLNAFYPYKDLIIRGGENIYPTEVEQFLYKHPKVQDVQVDC